MKAKVSITSAVRKIEPAPASMAEIFETKYCERCGRLSLREAGPGHSAEKYCPTCAEIMAGLAPATDIVAGNSGARFRTPAPD
jgi:hypothetical protein